MQFKFKDKVAILVNGKIVETFINKKIMPCCNATMIRFVVFTKGYEEGKFSVLKI